MSVRGFSGLAGLFLMGVGFGPTLSFGQVPKFTISTFAGNGTAGFAGDGGAATAANLSFPAAMTFDGTGNAYISDSFNSRIRKVDTNGTITTFAGNGTFGFTGDGAAASSATINRPYGLAFDKAGNLYFADTYNDLIRKVTISSGVISTVGGFMQGFGGDGGPASAASFDTPTAVVFDAAGNLYIADTLNHRIRKIGTDGNISTFAGTGGASSSGDGGPATSAALNSPVGLAIDSAGNVYVSESAGHRVRKITPDGTITTIAGNGSGGFQGDGGPATQASLYYPKGIVVDPSGNLYIADWLNSRVRVVTPDGNINTIAGNGSYDYYGDGGPATSAALKFPWGLTFDSAGNLYVADDENSTIRKLTPVPPLVSAIPKAAPQINVSGGVISDSGFGGFSAVAPGSWIEIHGSNLATHSRAWTAADFNGTQAPTSLDGTGVTIGGHSGFVSYISPTQIIAQVPSTVGLGAQDVRVTTSVGTSDPQTIAVNQIEPGLLAPAALKIGGKQYAEALFPDGATFVLPAGAMGSVVTRPAHPGDTIILYGVGFGSVTPDPGAGNIVQGDNRLVFPFQVFFGGVPAAVTYAGLAPGMIGLYQFNVVVPETAPGDAVPLTFSVGLTPGQQVLYTAIQ